MERKREGVLAVPEESVEEADIPPIIRLLEKLHDKNRVVRWSFIDQLATGYIYKDLPEGTKRRFQLCLTRISSLRLTPRERQVALCIVGGLGNREIAERIGTTKDTVNKQVQSLRRKLGIRAVGLDDRVTTLLTLLGL